MPDGAVATDGKPLRLSDYRGKLLVLHFFQAGSVTGHQNEGAEVEKVLVPLHQRWHERGLELVGVSLDLELTADRVKTIEANWDEWGTGDKEGVHDGSRAAVARWLARRGVSWRWHWDGQWTRNVLARTYGIH
jgi:hypothetical protein